MAVNGFHSEWVTIGRHRVFLECRCSFPGEEMMLIARVAAKVIDSHSEDARLVNVFFDDNVDDYILAIASDNREDRKLEKYVDNVLRTLLRTAREFAQVIVVKPGNKQSEHYNHMEHLSRGAGGLVA